MLQKFQFWSLETAGVIWVHSLCRESLLWKCICLVLWVQLILTHLWSPLSRASCISIFWVCWWILVQDYSNNTTEQGDSKFKDGWNPLQGKVPLLLRSNIEYIFLKFCQICRKGDNEELLLLCDGCDRGYHTYCCVVSGVTTVSWLISYGSLGSLIIHQSIVCMKQPGVPVNSVNKAPYIHEIILLHFELHVALDHIVNIFLYYYLVSLVMG